jgi:hypothetical protein
MTRLDVGVPSSSSLKILEGDCQSLHRIGWVGVSSIDLWPEWPSVRAQSRFGGLDPFVTFLLSVILQLAKDARLAIPIGLVTLVVILSPGFILRSLLVFLRAKE